MHYTEAPVYNAISYATLKLRSDLVWPDSLSSYLTGFPWLRQNGKKLMK